MCKCACASVWVVSSSLYWTPPEEDKYLGSALRFALRGRYGVGFLDRVDVGAEDLEWLRGYVAGGGQGCDEAEKLIGLVERYGSVSVWESQ